MSADLEKAVAQEEHHAGRFRTSELAIHGEAERVSVEPVTAREVRGVQENPAAEHLRVFILPRD